MIRTLAGGSLLLLGVALAPLAAQGGTLAEVQSGAGLRLCANPEALPFSGQDPSRPGIQLELAQKIAGALGVKTSVGWIFDRRAAGAAGCEVFMSAIVTPRPRAPMRLTRPYSGSGYVLIVPRNENGVRTFADLGGRKIGVLVQSLAQWVLTKRGLTTTPAFTEEELIELILTGQAAAGAVSMPYAGWYLKAHPDAPLKIADGYVLEPDLRWNVAVGLRNADQALIDAVSHVLDDLRRAGTIQATFSKYGVPYYQPFSAE
jgi:polar amino acid transport system substrate-binding protein